MAASKTRIDWALFLLRLAVGGMAVMQGFSVLRGAHGAITMAHASTWGLALGELVCGVLILLGIWVSLAGGILAAVLGWPLVHGWMHGAGLLSNLSALFRLLVGLACALGGGGKWALDR
ncbi:hypothetical protein GETHLI_06000 [Geothrix limicola]|uniref:DoxX family protein n=1 Tax=Geothrix limicola TaxID=2927978 RepID=A0ABQ5QBP1_9BACT|nr:hypothetical protein [Geothrix limicola]GLH72098.1 hypothetical protein GETHLI_06000 [Geothrix limicola]